MNKSIFSRSRHSAIEGVGFALAQSPRAEGDGYAIGGGSGDISSVGGSACLHGGGSGG